MKRKKPTYALVLIALWVLSISNYLWAEGEPKPKTHPERTITAIRVNPKPPKIDGILNDEVWQQAKISSDFLIKDPVEMQGQPATEKTTLQIAYDDDALYVGVMCYDSEPEKIVSRLTRRDAEVVVFRVDINSNLKRT